MASIFYLASSVSAEKPDEEKERAAKISILNIDKQRAVKQMEKDIEAQELAIHNLKICRIDTKSNMDTEDAFVPCSQRVYGSGSVTTVNGT